MPAEKRGLELSKDGVAWYSQGSEQHGLGDVHLAKQGCKSTPVCQPFLLAEKRATLPAWVRERPYTLNI